MHIDLSLVSTGLAGALIGVGVAWGGLVANLRALAQDVHSLRTMLNEQIDAHDNRIRIMESEQVRQSVKIAALEARTAH